MEKQKRTKIKTIFRRRIQTPWVVVVLAVTLSLTGLFYYSQNQQIVVYSNYMDTLSDYKYQEMRLMRSMERIRARGLRDSSYINSQLMVLREMAVSLSASAEHFTNQGDPMPPVSLFIAFEREVLSRVAAIRRYMNLRREWFSKLENFYNDNDFKTINQNQSLRKDLEKMRLGDNILPPDFSEYPLELSEKLKSIYLHNDELSALWARFDNDRSILICEDLLQHFKLRNLEELAFKFNVQMVFYFLSILMLLATVFFAFYSRLSTDKT